MSCRSAGRAPLGLTLALAGLAGGVARVAGGLLLGLGKNRLRGAPGGISSTSNECNYALVEDDGILCVGLANTSTSPANVDVMLARVLNGVTDDVFADGFE